MQNSENAAIQEESHLKVLRLLEQNPTISQRELAEALGISVGKINYCIKALVNKGSLKIKNFRNNKNKLVYTYLLTPTGISQRTELTIRFLKRKKIEYEIIKNEIEDLTKEIKILNEINMNKMEIS